MYHRLCGARGICERSLRCGCDSCDHSLLVLAGLFVVERGAELCWLDLGERQGMSS